MVQKCCVFLFCIFCIGLLETVQADRGDSCVTPTGESAICISVYDCNIFIAAIKRKNPSEITFIKRSQCGYDTQPLVCCGSRVDFLASRFFEEDEEPFQFTRSTAIPDRSTCGIQESDKNNGLEGFIHGGTEADLKEFPWMARLGYLKENKLEWNCGGSLISPRYILTAAHCVTEQIQNKVGRLSYVLLGEHDTENNIDCKPNGYICNNDPDRIDISSIIIHENYDSKVQSNDIALLELDRNVDYTDSIKPICLPEPNEESLRSGELLITSGWGITETGSRSQVKLKVLIPYRTKDECAEAFKDTRVEINDNQICAGGEEGKDSCQGDSGGPLMNRSKNETWYQEGITSFGHSVCGTKGFPGIYTKVSSFLPWIHEHVTD